MFGTARKLFWIRNNTSPIWQLIETIDALVLVVFCVLTIRLSMILISYFFVFSKRNVFSICRHVIQNNNLVKSKSGSFRWKKCCKKGFAITCLKTIDFLSIFKGWDNYYLIVRLYDNSYRYRRDVLNQLFFDVIYVKKVLETLITQYIILYKKKQKTFLIFCNKFW